METAFKVLGLLPWTDWAAVAVLFLGWIGYAVFAKRRSTLQPSLLDTTNHIRRHWMLQSTYREVRVVDGIVIQSLSSSPSFFASTTILIIGGLLAVLGTTEKASELVREIPFAARTSVLVFDLKIVLLLGIFVYAFFRFTWSLRQYTFGALLVGALLGSYEAMRAGGFEDQIPIRILGYFANAKMINALLEQLDPHKAAKVMHLGDDPVGVMTKVQECLEHGEFVAMMADRTGLNERTVLAEFFGQPDPFAAGPFLLASILRCPVYLVFGLYTEPNRYDLHCERFADRIDLPRKDRDGAMKEWVQRYAARIEHHARNAPLNWFNFFDFWAKPGA